jgi:hypothetical protein
MKQLIFGLSWVGLALSIIWIIKTNFDWEPMIAFISSIVGIITTFKSNINSKKLAGTWRSTTEGSEMKSDSVVLLGYNKKFEGAIKLKLVIQPGLPYFSELHIYFVGDIHIKEKSIYSQYSNVEVFYNYAFPQHVVTGVLAELYNSGPEEIMDIDDNKMTLKTSKGSLSVSKRISKEIDVNYLKKFIERS